MKRTAMPARRARKCAICRETFSPRSMTHRACSIPCAAMLAQAERERAGRRALAARRLALKPRSQWLAEAQAEFNSFIRARDARQPCISCGRMHQGAHDAGHYRSVGSMPALRFHEDNCHRQCVPCNQHLAGNIVLYRIGLIARIGVAAVEFLEGPHSPAKFTIEDAKAIKALYRAKLKELQHG